MITPLLKDNALLDDMKNVNAASRHFQIWWLGQSGFLIHWRGQYLLMDPYLSDSLTKKYADSDIPHVRMTELVIDPVKLDFIDVVTSSHTHTDHLDAETLQPLMQVNPDLKMIIPEANRNFVVDRLQCALDWPIGLNENEEIVVGHFTFHGIPAAHNLIERNEANQCHFLGYIVSFGPYTIYHSGDTLWYDGMVNILSRFSIDLALLPINGHQPERRVAGNLSAEEAASLSKAIGARLVMPCHYDMFTFNTEDPGRFVRAAEEIDQSYKILQCGQRWSSHDFV